MTTTRDTTETLGAAPAARVREAPPAATRWACVQVEGPRTRNEDGSLHPIFTSDQHLDPHNRKLIRCPECGSTSVRLAFDKETDTPPPEPRRDPRLVEMERNGFHNRRPGG